MSATRTIPLNSALVALLTEAQTRVVAATAERDTIVRTVLASQNITDPVQYSLVGTSLVIGDPSTEPMP